MCCIFTCCGWILDLVQRFWTFVMSCCISSAVYCVLIISAMAGIALGYNYSLAEYMDLKEANVSIFLKRGIFDDEIEDLQLRRANPMQAELGLRSGAESKNGLPSEESSTLRSGRRLDDSVFDAGDQNKYEGSLMKLTAKPPFEHTTTPRITEDFEMQEAIKSYTQDTLDALKAVQSVIDARRAYAQTLRGPTLSPVPTFPFNEVERLGQAQQPMSARRGMMPDPNQRVSLNPARLAVPNRDIGSDISWVAPIRPEIYKPIFKEAGLEHEPTTFPSPIPFKPGPIRPTPTGSHHGLFLTNYKPVTLFSTRSTYETGMTVYPKDPKMLSFKEKLMAENDRPLRKHRPKSEEEYDYDVKGLPVRKRRNINLEERRINKESYGIPYRDNKILKHADITRGSKVLASNKSTLNENCLLDLLPKNQVHNQTLSIELNLDIENNSKYKNEWILYTENLKWILQENKTLNFDSTTETTDQQNINRTKYQTIKQNTNRITHQIVKQNIIGNTFDTVKPNTNETNMFTHFIKNIHNVTESISRSYEHAHIAHAVDNKNDNMKLKDTLLLNKIIPRKCYSNVKSKEHMTYKEEKISNTIRNFSHVQEITNPRVIITLASYTT